MDVIAREGFFKTSISPPKTNRTRAEGAELQHEKKENPHNTDCVFVFLH